MASNQEQVSSLPLPPVQHIGQYTDENVKRGRAPKPPPPIQDTYTMFGRTFNQDDPIIRPLESQGIKRLYPQHPDRRKELKKLNHSLLVNFLDLIDLLVKCPESARRSEKVDDISILFIHMHHLINEFRPHQARETLRVMLELQCRQRTETTIRYQKHVKKAREMLQQAIDSLPQLEENKEKVLINNKANILELKAVTESDGQEKEFHADKYKVIDVIMCKEADEMLSKRYHKRFKRCFPKTNIKP